MTRVWALAALLAALSPMSTADPVDPWQVVDDAEGIVVESRAAPPDGVWMRGSRVLPYSAERIASVLLDLEAFPAWAAGLARWEVSGADTPEPLVYGRHDLPWPLADRDYVVRYRATRHESGALRLRARSTVDPRWPPTPEATRLTNLTTTWDVEPVTPDSSRVVYTYRGSVGRASAALLRFTRSRSLRASFERLAARVADVTPAR